jgi:hypothetical protein
LVLETYVLLLLFKIRRSCDEGGKVPSDSAEGTLIIELIIKDQSRLKLNAFHAFYRRARLSRTKSLLAGAPTKKKRRSTALALPPDPAPINATGRTTRLTALHKSPYCHTQELTHIPKVRIQFAEFLYLHFPILLEPWRLRSPDAVRYGFFL